MTTANDLSPDWPPAVEILNAAGRSALILICEHASNHIPSQYARLGLDDEDLARHIAWDIGAADVTRALSKRLDATAFLSGYSRLLIDLNRPLHVADSIPQRSEATEIPGNCSLAVAERERRARLMFHPFHDSLRAHIDRRAADGRRNVLIAIHSFTPVYLGQSRAWHAGVLFDKAEALGQALIAHLRRDPSLNVDANVPYSVGAEEDYALVVHGDLLGNPAALIEIRNDLIADAAGVAEWTDRLAPALSAAQTISTRSAPQRR